MYLAFIYEPQHRWPPGTMINSDPVVGELTRGPVWRQNDYTITGQARYKTRARVLHAHHYRFDEISDLSPYDLVLGWKRMSEQSVLDKFSISQSARWYEFSWSGPAAIAPSEVGDSCGNMHLIPGDAAVRAALGRARAGDVANMEGWLVNVTKPGGWEWSTGMRADSRGGHGCKIVYVEKFALETPG